MRTYRPLRISKSSQIPHSLHFTGSTQCRTGSIERPKPAHATEEHQTFPEKKPASELLSYNYTNTSTQHTNEMAKPVGK